MFVQIMLPPDTLLGRDYYDGSPVSRKPRLSLSFTIGALKDLGGLSDAMIVQASQDISTLKNMAGDTATKLGSFASSFIADLQDRIR